MDEKMYKIRHLRARRCWSWTTRQGTSSLNRQPTDLAIACRLVVDEVQAAHPHARIEVETVGDLMGDWDEARIEQAISNLVANAIQHGNGEVTLSLSGEDRDRVVLDVQNGGEPIPEGRLPTLFDAFQRGDRSPAGLGLGLFIVREIVRAHGGDIHVSSSSAGTTFRAQLPRRAAVETSASGRSSAGRTPLPPRVPGAQPTSSV